MRTQNYPACHHVASAMLDLCKSFVGRHELNGRWDEDGGPGATFWGTRSAVALLHAFCDGYFACLNETNQATIERALKKADPKRVEVLRQRARDMAGPKMHCENCGARPGQGHDCEKPSMVAD